MNKIVKSMNFIALTALLSGCVPAPKPQPPLGTTIGGGSQQGSSKYGARPYNYTSAIKSYFSTKVPRANKALYSFSKPKRAYKRKGFAYGGEIEWRGWLVETSMTTMSRSGRQQAPKPYLVLFKGEQVVNHILGHDHKLVVKVDK